MGTFSYYISNYIYCGSPQFCTDQTPFYFIQNVTMYIGIVGDSYNLTIQDGTSIRFELTDTTQQALDKVQVGMNSYVSNKYI